MLQEQVYLHPVRDVDDLRRRLIDSIQQTVIDQAIDQWRFRLRILVTVTGGHFEQLMWSSILLLQCTVGPHFFILYVMFHLNV